MAYKLTSTAWLTRETARVRGILLANLRNGVEYSGADLKTLVQKLGLTYTNAEFTQLSDALIADGTIEVA